MKKKYSLVQHEDSRPGCFYYSIPELSLVSNVVIPDQKKELQGVVNALNERQKKLVVKIEVKGGIASVISCPKAVVVEIIDRDGEAHG